uniref:Uncharacterized protein n=1 Tax=Apteryx owenii TaxID=8824 RepID=A0A8B9QBB0_APTOW
ASEHNPATKPPRAATCSVCLEFFKDPVSIECGHNFCRACIIKSWKDLEMDFPCPQCREVFQQKSFRPNRQLANMSEIISQFTLRGAKGAEEDGLCAKHREALKLYCKDDRRTICVVCDRSREHRPHAVVPIDEASEEYKEKIQGRLDFLKKERQELLEFKVNDDKKTHELLKTIENERQKLLSEFEGLRQFLHDQEHILLGQLEKMEKNIAKRQNENITDLSKEITLLNKLITELEEKIQQPVLEFLKDESPRRQGEAGGDPSRLPTLTAPSLSLPGDLSLDPDTANPYLVLSEDKRSVRLRSAPQELPANPKRFDYSFCVLAAEGFVAGRRSRCIRPLLPAAGAPQVTFGFPPHHPAPRFSPFLPRKGTGPSFCCPLALESKKNNLPPVHHPPPSRCFLPFLPSV